MNKFETLIYNIVRKNPALKQAIRNIYQTCFDVLPRKVEILPSTIQFQEEYFFGFHDISPLSEDETKLLAMHNSFDFKMPRSNEGLDIGYFDFDDGKIRGWHKIDESHSWNYHKGCRLQWIDNNTFIFNTAEGNSLCSKMISLNGDVYVVPFPIDSVFVSGDEKIATSFSYERLERCMPGYGYPYKDDGEIEISAPDGTGLYIVNLQTKERVMVLSLKEIALQVTGEIESEYLHFVTHTEFSKSGRYISFLYRRIPQKGNYMKRRSVMCVYDRQTSRLIVLPSQESGSHYVWNSRDQIIASCNIDGKNCHALFDMNNLSEVRIVDAAHLNSDGHQSFVTDTKFVTDTYPDKFRMAKLFVADITSNTSRLIASIYSPKKFQTKDFHCHIACDLHPRVLANGKYVCFDSPRTGKRGLYVMALK